MVQHEAVRDRVDRISLDRAVGPCRNVAGTYLESPSAIYMLESVVIEPALRVYGTVIYLFMLQAAQLIGQLLRCTAAMASSMIRMPSSVCYRPAIGGRVH